MDFGTKSDEGKDIAYIVRDYTSLSEYQDVICACQSNLVDGGDILPERFQLDAKADA